MNMRRLALCGVAVLGLLSACRRDVSGTYLVNDKVAVCWLQLVRTPDNRLTGQLISSVLKPDGEIERGSVSLTGAVDGENVTLSGGGFLGLSTTALSGALEGNRLTLTGVQSTPVTLNRSTLAEYQAKLSEQNNRSQAILSAKADATSRQKTSQEQESFVAEMNQLVGKMQQFDSEADIHLNRFPSAEKSYEAITAKMTEYITRERQLAGNPNLSNARAQLVNSATQASFATDQMHYQGQSLQSSLDTNIAPIAGEETALDRRCSESGFVRGNLTPAEIEARRDSCGRFVSVALLFRQKYNAVSAGLSHLDQVYKHEKDVQERLLEAAQKLE
jgi:hypothetical protein